MTDEDKTETQKQIESIRRVRESNTKYEPTTEKLREMFRTGDGGDDLCVHDRLKGQLAEVED